MFFKEELSSLSILIAAIIAIIRFNKISPVFYSFIFYIWVTVVNEVLSVLLLETGNYTAVNNNIYVLAEAILFTTFFRKMGIFGNLPKLFFILVTAWLSLWVVENFVLGKITYISSWFRITYSFFVVLMSITCVNKLILLDINRPVEFSNRHILKNPVFLICVGSVAFFTFKVLVEIFWLYGLNAGKGFRIKVYGILAFINLAVNLIYALAVLWIPPKQQYMKL